MRKGMLAVVWAASLLGAAWVGHELAGPSGVSIPTQASVTDPEEASRGDRPELVGRRRPAPSAEGREVERTGAPVADDSEAPPPVRAEDDAALRLLAELEALVLAGDPAAVLQRLSQAGDEQFFLRGGDGLKAQALRSLWASRLHENRGAVLDLLERLFESAARDPRALVEAVDGVDLATIDVFDGVLCALPLLASDAQLARFRGHVESLRAEAERLPEAYGGWDFEGYLVAWAEFLPPARALGRLESGDAETREILVLLNRLDEEQRRALDPLPLLLRLVHEPRWRAFGEVLRLIHPLTGDVRALDDAVIAARRSPPASVLAEYLYATERGDWPAGRAYLERGLEVHARHPSQWIASLVHLQQRPSDAYVRGLLALYEVDPYTKDLLRVVYVID